MACETNHNHLIFNYVTNTLPTTLFPFNMYFVKIGDVISTYVTDRNANPYLISSLGGALTSTDGSIVINGSNIQVSQAILNSIISLHNNFPDLQGGAPGEYYHLTENEHTAILAMIGSGGTQNLDEVLTIGNTSDQNIVLQDGTTSLNYSKLGQDYTKGGFITSIEYANPVTNVKYTIPAKNTNDTFAMLSDITSGTGTVESVTGENVDNTDPNNPVIGNPNLLEVLTEGGIATSLTSPLSIETTNTVTFYGEAGVNIGDGGVNPYGTVLTTGTKPAAYQNDVTADINSDNDIPNKKYVDDSVGAQDLQSVTDNGAITNNDINVNTVGVNDPINAVHQKIIGIDEGIAFGNGLTTGANYLLAQPGSFGFGKSDDLKRVTQNNNLLTANRDYSWPDENGTVALKETQTLQSVTNNGAITTESIKAAGVVINDLDGSGSLFNITDSGFTNFSYRSPNGFDIVFIGAANTDTRNYTLPNASGTLMLESQASKLLKVSTVDSSVLTGTTAETVFSTCLIPANSGTGILECIARFSKTGTAGSTNIKFYRNTTPDLSGSPVQIGAQTASATNLTHRFSREFEVKASTIEGYGFATTAANDYATSTGAMGSTAWNGAVNQYIISVASLGNAADSLIEKSFTVAFKKTI